MMKHKEIALMPHLTSFPLKRYWAAKQAAFATSRQSVALLAGCPKLFGSLACVLAFLLLAPLRGSTKAAQRFATAQQGVLASTLTGLYMLALS